jgi:hypothetical protein
MVSNLLVTSNRLRILLKIGVEVSSILVAGIGGAGFSSEGHYTHCYPKLTLWHPLVHTSHLPSRSFHKPFVNRLIPVDISVQFPSPYPQPV